MSEFDARQQAKLKKMFTGAPLTEEQARAIYAQGPEAVVFALLTLSAGISARYSPLPVATPSTPSGMIPVYQKPESGRRRKKPGRKKGHPGSRRLPPSAITKRKKHELKMCPKCGGKLGPPSGYRKRLIEDIPENIQPEVTEHTIPRCWCPRCNKIVEPPVEDAFPRATVGNRLVALSAWLHYGLGTTIAQIIAVLNAHLHFKITQGALVDMWHRLATILETWYDAIAEQARTSAVLHADETGWRVNGKGKWLWCFTSPRITWYMIDRCRGSPVVRQFLIKEFAGTLVSDFWGAYNCLEVAFRQVCLAHLVRDLETVELYKDHSGDWDVFAKKLQRIVGDALRLKKNDAVCPESFDSRKQRLYLRVDELVAREWSNAQARRLVKRLRRHRNHLFTFLDHDDVPADNNRAEREIRPAVIMRKNSGSNRSEQGAHTQAVLMSVYRTLKLRGHDPMATIVSTVTGYIRTGHLPPLPE